MARAPLGARIARRARRTARAALVRIRTAGRPRAAILMYHRIATPRADPWRMAVSPAHFAEQMAVLRAWGRTATLDAVAGGLARGGGADCRIAVTFDDGYRDTLLHALPVLEREGIPATLYAVSGALGDPAAFWWDTLSRAFLETAALPEQLRFDLGGTRAGWSLGAAAVCGPAALARAALWSPDTAAPRDRRQRLMLEIWDFLAGLPADPRRAAAAQLADWAGPGAVPGKDDPAAPLTPEELCRLAASPLIGIGGHTESHCDLSRTPDAHAAQEIARDRAALRRITGQPVDHFGHPYGRRGPATRAHLVAAGYTTATTSRPGLATSRDDPYGLPRIQVPDVGGADFATLLAALTGLPRPA